MRYRYSFAVIVCALVSVENSSFAHHSRAPYYDFHTITVAGTVTGVALTNPHSYIYLDARKPGGAIEKWTIEMYPTGLMARIGIEQDTIKIGDPLTVRGLAPKAGAVFSSIPALQAGNAPGTPPHVTFGLELTLANGKKVVTQGTDASYLKGTSTDTPPSMTQENP